MGTFRQMQDERFAEIASERGAFGLGKMIEAHLARFTADPAPNGGPTAAQATLPEVTGNGI
jgi:flagellar protein FlgJ